MKLQNMSILIFKYLARGILCCNTVLLHILSDPRHVFMEKIFMVLRILHNAFWFAIS